MRFRALVLVAAFVGLTATPSLAQGNFSGGVKGGVNFAKLAIDPEETECCDNRTGFAGGLFVVAPINDAISIQPEFLYSMQGAKFVDDDSDAELEINLDFFQVPILVRADFASNGSVQPFVVFGPSIGFRMRAKQKFEEEEEDIKEEVEKVDFSFAVGGGLQFGRGSLEARYTHGLKDISTNDEDEAKTRMFSVLLGYRF